jgi:hypothetical protein
MSFGLTATQIKRSSFQSSARDLVFLRVPPCNLGVAFSSSVSSHPTVQLNAKHDGNSSPGDSHAKAADKHLAMKDEKEIETEPEYQFDSLDVMLDRARKRKMVMLPYQIQAITNKPLIPINLNRTTYLTIGEVVLILVAFKLESYGFCFGYVLGKSTRGLLMSKGGPILLVELWTVFLAVSLDIAWNNIF